MQISSISGFHVSNRKGMQHWNGLLEKWIEFNERYCCVMKGGDAPFLYTERSHVGMLSAAAWHSGLISLEEFQHKKGYKNKKKHHGRADLYIGGEGIEDFIEAKFSWISLDSKRVKIQAENTLTAALIDVGKTAGGKLDETAVGVAFLSMYSKNKIDIEEKIHETIETIKKIQSHAIAWCFPEKFRFEQCSDKTYAPGVLVLASRSKQFENKKSR